MPCDTIDLVTSGLHSFVMPCESIDLDTSGLHSFVMPCETIDLDTRSAIRHRMSCAWDGPSRDVDTTLSCRCPQNRFVGMGISHMNTSVPFSRDQYCNGRLVFSNRGSGG